MIGRLATSNFGDQGRKITASDTAPSSPIEGDFWYKTDVGTTLVYYDGFWVELAGVGASAPDHGSLSGLADDDHTQYLLADGTRTATELTVSGDLTVNGNLSGTLKSPYELWSVVAGAPTTGANHPIDLLTATAWYYTSNNTGNFEFNFRGDSSTTLDSLMVVGEAVTTSVLVTNGATAYYNTNTLVDGVSQTVEWQNASGPSAGNANQIDTYTFTIIKTASATFAVLGSFTTFG